MEKGYLIDTSAVIKYLNETITDAGLQFIDGIINTNCSISFITEIELQVWSPTNDADIDIYQSFVSQIEIMGIDESVITKTIHIRKTHRLKLPDALIAATALSYDMTLIADNDKDFEKVAGLKYINPNK